MFDTIVAPITGNQPAAVAVVRLSGHDAWSVASAVFAPWPPDPESHKAVFGKFVTGDDGLALPFAEGHGYTGDAAVEFSIHGSPASVRTLVEACLRHGARPAEPGEFTLRAFLNGRIDLTQAEGVRDTVAAQTDAQLRQANLHRSGVLHRELTEIRSELESVLAAVEASVDFSEEIGEFDRRSGTRRLDSLLQQVEVLLETAPAGRVLREGLRIAIVGPPNAGKSSLLNALLGSDRAIVTPIPGTTRDYIEERVELGGILCVLIDTAGLRESADTVEAIGIQRARAMAANADEVWYVFDSTIGWTDFDEEAAGGFGRPVLVLANKADLLPQSGSADNDSRGSRKGTRLGRTSLSKGMKPCWNAPELHAEDGENAEFSENKRGARNDRISWGGAKGAISALTREGLPALIEHVSRNIEGAGERPFINMRHQPALTKVCESLRTCLACLEHDLPDDLLSVGLRDAIHEIGMITGQTASSDIIDRIFHDFCIGK